MLTLASLRFEPLLPIWLLISLGLFGAAVVAVGLRAGARGALTRATGFLLILTWLSGPTLLRETRHGLSDIALLVVDHSGSMGVADRLKRTDDAATNLQAQLAKFPGLELRKITVPEAGHDGTQLWTAARGALSAIPPDRLAGIMVLSDGQIADLPPSPPEGAPLHVLIPAAGEQWDRVVRVLQAPGYGIVGHPVVLRVQITDLGQGAPQGTATLTVRQDNGTPFSLEVPVGTPQDISLPINRAGPSLVQLSTPTLQGEASGINNAAVVQINGVRDRLRVLLVSGEPNQGERTWRRLLKSDPAVDLVHFTILRSPEKDDSTPLNELALIAFPTHELFAEKLGGFDLIILDRFADRGLLPHLYLRNIADYVRNGGALLLVTGPEFASPESLDNTPLAEILPAHAPYDTAGVLSGAFKPTVTAEGLRHPVTENLTGANTPTAVATWGPWYRAIQGANVQGQVLMTGPGDTPLLVLDRVGQGRVAMLMSDQIWLWSRGHQGGGPQAELLRRVAHWLMKEPELDEDQFRATLAAGQLKIERRTIEPSAAGPVTVTAPDGSTQTIPLLAQSPGRATATLPAPQPGVWQASDGTHTAFAVLGQENPPEYADLRATAERVAPLVHAAGGGIVWLASDGVPRIRRVGPDQLAAGGGWIGLRERGAHLVTGVDSFPLLPPWLALSLLLGVLAAAWWREAR